MQPVKKPLPTDLPLEVQQKLLFQPETNPTSYVALKDADAFGFEPAATALSRSKAWWLADASWLAYWRDPNAVARVFHDQADMACQFASVEGAEAYFASSDHFGIVAFRGTQSDDWPDLFDDVCYRPVEWDTGHVHAGFARRLDRLEPDLTRFLGQHPAGWRVWFTGHSLGAAVATLAAYRHRDVAGGVCTFGSPLVGNAVFSSGVGKAFQGRSARYVNDHDIVTRVPPPPFAFPNGFFTHVDQLRWIDKDGVINGTAPSTLSFVRNVFGSPKAVLDAIDLHRLDAANVRLPIGRHLTLPDGLSDHTPLFYALHCWNDFVAHAGQTSS